MSTYQFMTKTDYEKLVEKWDNHGPVLRACLNNVHAAKRVKPVIEARRAGTGKIRVLLAWQDEADRTFLPEVLAFSGEYNVVENWLMDHDVLLDTPCFKA